MPFHGSLFLITLCGVRAGCHNFPLMLLLPFHIFGQIYNYTTKVLNEYISQWYFPNGIHDVSLPGEKSVPFYIT